MGRRCVRSAFYRSLIRSDVRLDYEQVDRMFAGTRARGGPVGRGAGGGARGDAALGRARERAGGLVLDSEEPEVVFDEEGNVREIAMRAQTESHRLIEHLMIAANEAVARHLSERGVPCLYRVHERPRARAGGCGWWSSWRRWGCPRRRWPTTISPSQAAELMGELSQRVERHVARCAGARGAARGRGRGAGGSR